MTEISEGKDALLVDCGHFENLVAKGQGGRASNVAIIDGNYNECGSLREVAVDMASRVMEAAAGYSGISEGRTEKVGRGREQGIGAAQERIDAICENKPESDECRRPSPRSTRDSHVPSTAPLSLSLSLCGDMHRSPA